MEMGELIPSGSKRGADGNPKTVISYSFLLSPEAVHAP